jgi:hypothetical protein
VIAVLASINATPLAGWRFLLAVTLFERLPSLKKK